MCIEISTHGAYGLASLVKYGMCDRYIPSQHYCRPWQGIQPGCFPFKIWKYLLLHMFTHSTLLTNTNNINNAFSSMCWIKFAFFVTS